MVQLTQEQIKKNKSIFLQTNATHNIIPQELIDFLGEDFFTAPASTSTSMHNACEGGLVDHILSTAKFANKINKMLPEHMQVPALSLYRIAFLFDIGKTFLFVPNQYEWSKKNGKIYEYSNNTASMRVGERSALYASRYMKLEEEEYQAIINSDREELETQIKWFGSSLTIILRQAIEWAIREQKSRV